ncbi:MAG: polysaccharide biosynthesis/export family protein [Kiritimatiellia bacterium]
MKFQAYSAFAILLAASLLLGGCTSIIDFFDPSPNLVPGSWAPRLPDDAPVRTTAARLLRQDDDVQVTVRAGAIPAIQAADIVDSHGNVTLPHLGEFRVGGLTSSEAEQAIRDAYVKHGFFTSPEVTLIGGPRVEPEYFVSGAVNRKGSFPFKDGITLWQAIVAAGDVNQYAGGKVKLVRDGVTEIHDLNRIKRGRAKNPLLRPGDMIEVLESWL